MKRLKEFWKNFRLNHHSCSKHSKLIDSFTTRITDGSSSVITSTNVYKCTICGKILDVD